MTKILGFETHDVRFPDLPDAGRLGRHEPGPGLLGRGADPAHRRAGRPGRGNAHVFTIGRGNEIQLSAIRAFEPFLAGLDLDEVLSDLGGPGPAAGRGQPAAVAGGRSAGVVHMALGAVLNACWDLAARRAGKPLWLLLAGLSPEEIVGLVDFPVPDRRAHPGRRPRTAGAGGRRAGDADPGPAGPGVPGLHHHPRLAGLLRRPAGAALRGGRPGRLQPGQAQGGGPARGRQEAHRGGPGDGGRGHRDRPGREPGVGCGHRDRLGAGAGRRPAPSGSRSRPARTTSWAPRPSAGRCTRSGWPPASTSPTGSSSSSCSRPGPSTSCRSTPAGSAGSTRNIANLLLAAKFGVPVCPHAGGVGPVRDGPAPCRCSTTPRCRPPSPGARSNGSTTCTSISTAPARVETRPVRGAHPRREGRRSCGRSR